MELALVLLFVLVGTGAIVYAGLRRPARKPEPGAADGTPIVVDADGDAGGGDGGGGD